MDFISQTVQSGQQIVVYFMCKDSKAIISSALNTEVTTYVLYYIKSNIIDVEGIILLCRMPFLMNSHNRTRADHIQTANK